MWSRGAASATTRAQGSLSFTPPASRSSSSGMVIALDQGTGFVVDRRQTNARQKNGRVTPLAQWDRSLKSPAEDTRPSGTSVFTLASADKVDLPVRQDGSDRPPADEPKRFL